MTNSGKCLSEEIHFLIYDRLYFTLRHWLEINIDNTFIFLPANCPASIKVMQDYLEMIVFLFCKLLLINGIKSTSVAISTNSNSLILTDFHCFVMWVGYLVLQ